MNKKHDSGIVISKELKLKSLITNNLPMYVRIIQIILIFLAAISPVLSFVNATDIKCDIYSISTITLFAIVIEYIAFRIMKNKDNSTFAMLVILIFCITIIVLRKKLMLGLLCFVDEYIDYFNFKFNKDYILKVKIEASIIKNAPYIVMMVVVFMSLIMAYLIVVKMNKITYILTSIIWPILCYFVDLKPQKGFFIVYIIVSVVILSIEHKNKNNNIENQESNFFVTQKIFRDVAAAKIELMVALFAVCFFVLFNIILNQKKFEENTSIKNISSYMRTGIENIINNDMKTMDAFDREVGGNDTKDLKDLLNTTPVLNNGAISEGGNARYYNKKVFRLVSNEVNDTLYLKQFVGIEYKNGWISKIKDKSELSKLSICDNMLKNVMNSKTENLDKTLYYDMVGILTNEMRDNLIPTGSNENYEIGKNGVVNYINKNVTVVAGYELEFQNIYSSLENIQLEYESNDEDKIRKLYLDVPDKLYNSVEKIKPEIDKYVAKIMLKDNITEETVVNKDKLVIRALVNYLNYNFEYTLSPGRPPNNMDPVEYFLLENKRGYCMYYAAAATAILRYYGIPTRYVEGYVVRTKDCENGKRIDSREYVKKLGVYNTSMYDFNNVPLYEYDIKDTNGHAWVEVFISGLGWVPVEVTPTRLGQNDEVWPEEEKDKVISTAKPTESPQGTMKPTENSESGTQENKKDNKENTHKELIEDNVKKNYMPIIIVSIVLTCVIIFMCIKCFKSNGIVDKQKKLRINNRLQYACKMSIYILKRNNIDFKGTMNYKEYARSIHKKYSSLKLENIETIIEYILKNQYSNSKLDIKEENDIIEFYNYLVSEYVEQYKGFRRIKECYVNNYIRKV